MGTSEIVARVVEDLKDESEPYRRMVMETIDKVRMTQGGCATMRSGRLTRTGTLGSGGTGL